MQSPVVHRINVFSKQIHKTKYFMLMEIYYKLMHVFCFLDLGFFKNKFSKRRIFWKSVTIVELVMFCCVSYYGLDIQRVDISVQITYYYSIITYICYVLALILVNPNKTFYRLFFDLESIDYMLRINSSSYNLEIKLLVCNLLQGSFRCLMFIIYTLSFGMGSDTIILRYFILTCLNVVLITYTFLFYSINCRLNALMFIIKPATSNFTSLQLIYKAIVELTLKYKNAFDPLVSKDTYACYILERFSL